MQIFNHLLTGKQVTYLPCPKNETPLVEPDTVVLHYTAASSARGAAEYLCRPEVKASAHVVVGRRGEVFQLVPFCTEAWHAGRSSLLGRADVNHFSIGIELDNLGQLQEEAGRFVAECGKVVDAREVFTREKDGQRTYWHRYTPRQAERLQEVIGLLEECYSIYRVVGHSDITRRKVDPGPALDEVLPGWRWIPDDDVFFFRA